METLDTATTDINATQEQAKKITAINRDVVHKICSGQVVLNLATAVKELVENALDAGATMIEVRLKEYGKDLIEVVDNGSGVVEENFSGLTLKYHTSKLREFSDLLGVSTFGFRGEALSSLCALSDLTIITRHSSTDCGTKINYDYKGEIKNTIPCSRQVGTTVSLSNVFCTLPVRQKEFHRNIKREFNKMTQLLYAYCLVSERVKIVCTNQTNKGTKSIVVATQGGLVRDNIACVFGVKQLQSLMDLTPYYPGNHISNIKENIFNCLKQEISDTSTVLNNHEDVADINELELSEDSSNDDSIIPSSQEQLSQASSSSTSMITKSGAVHCPFNFTGYISSCSHGCGRSTTERQFFYVNSRPCEPNKIMKIVNEVYKQYNPHQSPFVFLNLKLKQSNVDVNVTPDKRKVFLDKEKSLMDVIKFSMVKIFENVPSTLKIENIESSVQDKSKGASNISSVNTPRVFSSFLSQFASRTDIPVPALSSSTGSNIEIKRKSTSLDNYVSRVKLPRKDSLNPTLLDNINNTSNDNSDEENDTIQSENNHIDSLQEDTHHDSDLEISSISNNQNKEVETPDNSHTNNISEKVYLGFSDNVPESQIVGLSQVLDIKPAKNQNSAQLKNKKTKSPNVTIDYGNRTVPSNRKTVPINITVDQIKALVVQNNDAKDKKRIKTERVKFRSKINPVQNKKCEDELQKEISKDMFKEMLIIGQFNLGFIITQLDEDLFIIDQHATDEKYNYETLQKTTTLSNQRLVVPQPLELTGVNERVLIDNLEICRKNGFTFEINEDAPPTKRVKLLTIPISKNWVFGKEDIEEMLFMLKDYPQEVCRPSRVQAMFASRACRKSVMIGSALSQVDMRKLIDHMGEIEQPWNCPHGRPTIRHLINMGLIHSSWTKNCL